MIGTLFACLNRIRSTHLTWNSVFSLSSSVPIPPITVCKILKSVSQVLPQRCAIRLLVTESNIRCCYHINDLVSTKRQKLIDSSNRFGKFFMLRLFRGKLVSECSGKNQNYNVPPPSPRIVYARVEFLDVSIRQKLFNHLLVLVKGGIHKSSILLKSGH